MATQILIPYGKMQVIEDKLMILKAPASRPTIRRALSGAVPKKSKIKEYKLIRAIALENGGAEIK
ncbi:MAG: hypothetical protein M0O93_06955 [Bacteroidales bacterium]|nr:hypothetical protein [Bacteroidales bacterium]